MYKLKIAILLGTRPEIIKMSPIIRYLDNLKEIKRIKKLSKMAGYDLSSDKSEDNLKNRLQTDGLNYIENLKFNNMDMEYVIIHTNQHYSQNMDKIFFDELNLPKSTYNLKIGSGRHGEQTGSMIVALEKVLVDEKPDVLFIQGDTNTVLAGAITASKMGIKIAHVEAGLRSFDRKMPEEVNRVLTDHVSDFLFAPTGIAKQNLLKEGIDENKIFVVGNTIVDATLQNLKIAKHSSKTYAQDPESKNKEDYFLLTLHRAENTDYFEKLDTIVDNIIEIANNYAKIIFPIHPRTLNKLKQFNLLPKLSNNPKIELIEPVGYLDFLLLESNAKLILTDSGGVQEEACILGVPCLTIRENTERPETVAVGSNIIVGYDYEHWINGLKGMLDYDADGKLGKDDSGCTPCSKKHWENPFGCGHSAETILEIVFSDLMDNNKIIK
ncbi:non-hydrolyzing UDP-N-acetylglucosamine 2-epimerase [Methanococcus voltae]|uniref:UDP-N-acetylglucosamine 2-epimerase n=1 Tax=Methanococcus voltae (strain ATCC BAA-1334 / A3) TaxID=456320 RepID=D7DS26_METV3|nr:UDP-N-acetylglucosamine 2-epimerase (non-hydrolyzing) [Methanococcus voltae]MCS3901461.1 UDP-N-acetylglucosamine 2-epimerase (non-hydrolyzing) [Methanococcus voltae]